MLHDRISEISPSLEAWWNHEPQPVPYLIAQTSDSNVPAVSENDNLDVYWNDAELAVRRKMALIDATTYHGLAVPYHYIDYGSSAMVCALGANPLLLDKNTIWAKPHLKSPEQICDLVIDRDNPALKTITATSRNSINLAYNHHMVSHFALNGIADIMAGLYGTEDFLMDLVTRQKEIKKAMNHLMSIWLEIFMEFNELLSQCGNPGSIGWAGVWAPGTTFPIQEDVSYMISPEMFRQFCLPHIVTMVEAMEYPFYHLDGANAIPHLDALLDIDSLKAIQWQPGAGNENLSNWYPLIQRILASGKSVQLYGNADEIDDLVKNVGCRGILVILENDTYEDISRLMDKYPQIH